MSCRERQLHSAALRAHGTHCSKPNLPNTCLCVAMHKLCSYLPAINGRLVRSNSFGCSTALHDLNYTNAYKVTQGWLGKAGFKPAMNISSHLQSAPGEPQPASSGV